jgi:hypothetical protein
MRCSLAFSPLLADLIAQSEEEWGNPEERRQEMLFMGINYLDEALYGLDYLHGELVGLQAEEKMRKSTVLYNILYNVALQLAARNQKRNQNCWICLDTLESGATPQAVKDIFIAMAATRKLIADVFGVKRKNWPTYDDMMQHPELAPELEISKDFLVYSRRTPKQHEAIQWAMEILSGLPIMIFGTSMEQGDARNLERAVQRWHDLYLGKHPQAVGREVRIFARDHLQQIEGYDNDYFKQEAVVNVDSNFVAKHPPSIVIDVSQVSLTSVRLEKQGLGMHVAKGGKKLLAEANFLLQTSYDEQVTPSKVRISIVRTRRRSSPPVIQEIEPNSGAFLRPAFPAGKF